VRQVQLDTKSAEIVVSVGFLVLAAIVVRETVRMGAGWGSSGPQPGFFPTIAALVMAVSALVTLLRATRSPGKPLFESREHAISVVKVGAPLCAAIAGVQFLGLYIVTALYMGFFSWWFGRHRWPVALLAAVVLPLVLFFTFERGFRISLPKSIWYGSLLGF
jgi:hypothetical protein